MERKITPLNILGSYLILRALYLFISPLFGIGFSLQGFGVIGALVLIALGLMCFIVAWSIRKWIINYLNIFATELFIIVILYLIDTFI